MISRSWEQRATSRCGMMRCVFLPLLLVMTQLFVPCQGDSRATLFASTHVHCGTHFTGNGPNDLSDDPSYFGMCSPRDDLLIYYRLEEVHLNSGTATALSVRMVYTVDRGGWIAFGFSPLNIPRMINSLAVAGPLDTNVAPQMYNLNLMFAPPISSDDLQDTLTNASMVVEGTNTILTFTKLIDNDLHKNLDFPEIDVRGHNTCLYAFGDSPNYPWSFHGPTGQSRGSITLDLARVPIWTPSDIPTRSLRS
jgi:hypothetical protein